MKSRLPRKRDWAEPRQTPDYPQLVRAQTTRANERLPDPQTCIGFSPMERRRLRRTVRTSWSAASLRPRHHRSGHPGCGTLAFGFGSHDKVIQLTKGLAALN